MKNLYLERYAWPGPYLIEEPDINTKLIVVIPCYNEPNVTRTLDSIYKCDRPDCSVEIIVVVNHAEDSPQEIKTLNQVTVQKIENWKKGLKKKGFLLYVICAFDLPKKNAGVGLARKIGMDEAVRRFERLQDKKGVIVCYDADCTCDSNYFKQIFQFYQHHPAANVALIHFEHPLEGVLNPEIYQGIINYELHLRYYKNALGFAQFPYSFHTIGSCITVTSGAYQKQNGMNMRKAGEDFYFLQKLFPLGNTHTITSTTIYPSPRSSDRVPFGTGKAITNYLQKKKQEYFTYSPKTFQDLKIFLGKLDLYYELNNPETALHDLPASIAEFLPAIDFNKNALKIKQNCRTKPQFKRSFYQWFNGFSVLKFVHFARDNFYDQMEILDATNWLLHELSHEKTPITDKKKALEVLRIIDKSQ